MRSLNVYVDNRLVGQLFEGDDLWRFEYDISWIEATDSFDLGPGLPRKILKHADGGSMRPVQWFFDNLLPEELLRQAVSKEAGIKGEDAFALLQYLGAESAGSLTLLPPGESLPQANALRDLPNEKLSARIAKLPRTTLTADAPKRMSLAGAQHKLLVVYRNGLLYEPEGATPSTHILKPNHPDTEAYPASVVNEYLTMRLARAVGLPVPEVHMFYVPEPVYVIQRFDRVVVDANSSDTEPAMNVQRKHLIDACQLLNKSRTFKHSGASIEALNHVIEATTNKASTRLLLFRWLVFNIAVANDDCHLKNLSFFVSAEGVQLAPHYDLLATSAYYTRAFAVEKATWANVRMAIPLGKVLFFSDVTVQLVVDAAQELGVPEVIARRILKEVTTRLPEALAREISEIRKRHAEAQQAARVFVGAEDRLLRVFEHIVLKEMLERLGN
ncbi:MAG: HipA domain-containing protein [Rhodoferax sp.]|jgi:serine/threonine-protein kinase HipA|nr:HipA domain-containing protein [Rhodoferax sp.]